MRLNITITYPWFSNSTNTYPYLIGQSRATFVFHRVNFVSLNFSIFITSSNLHQISSFCHHHDAGSSVDRSSSTMSPSKKTRRRKQKDDTVSIPSDSDEDEFVINTNQLKTRLMRPIIYRLTDWSKSLHKRKQKIRQKRPPRESVAHRPMLTVRLRNSCCLALTMLTLFSTSMSSTLRRLRARLTPRRQRPRTPFQTL